MPRMNKTFVVRQLNEIKARTNNRAFFTVFLPKFRRNYSSSFNTTYSAYLEKQIPKKTVHYYNNRFEKAYKFIEEKISDATIGSLEKNRALSIYQLNIGKTAKLRDLLGLDVFYKQTQNQDIPIEQIFTSSLNSRLINTNTDHSFFHRPQQSKFLFLHEIIVGHLVALNNKVQPNSKADDLTYYQDSTKVFYDLQKTLKISENDLITMHFLNSKKISSSLPKNIKEVLLSSAIIGWYFEVINYYSFKKGTTSSLSLIYRNFLSPCLKQLNADTGLSFKMNTHITICITFEKYILKILNDEKISRAAIIKDLHKLSDLAF